MTYAENTQAESAAGNEDEEKHFSYAMQLVTAGSLPMVLLAAFRLGLFEIIAKSGPGAQLSPEQIAGHLTCNNPDAVVMLDRMLRLLASHSVLTAKVEDGGNGKSGIQRVYGLAPVAKYFVGDPDLGGASLCSLLALLQDKVFSASWYGLEDVILRGGIPFNKVHGTDVFEYSGKDDRFRDVLSVAMVERTSIAINKILDSYKGFEHLKSLVDLGGGLGIAISKITAKYPTIKGINFDLPHIVQHAPVYSGVQHIGGDMFESVPNADAIFMKWILHDWDDDHCIKLLKNCYTSLPDNGKVIVLDGLLPLNPDASFSTKATCQMDMVMLTQTPYGKERSEQEFLSMATAAGFRGINKACFVCNVWLMEFYK